MRNYPLTLLLIWAFVSANGKVWTIDPTGTYTSLSSVSNLVADGDTILVKAGLYTDQPQAAFNKNNLLIKGIEGRPRIEAGKTLAAKSNGKALLVISGSNCVVEHIEFALAKVPDRNGAGIRQEGCNLTVRYCFFNGNEMGILGGNYASCKVTIEHCVFANNGSPSNPGYQHNVYINHIDTLVFKYNLSINAIAEGHELKSRAHHNIILYNNISNLTSVDSRNFDLPNGGSAIIMGNIIEQNQSSANSNMLGYGLEGLTNRAPHNLYVVNNSFVNKKSTGSFIQVSTSTDSLFVWNNILAGAQSGGVILGVPKFLDSSNNLVRKNIADVGFVNPSSSGYQLLSSSSCVNTGKQVTKMYGTLALIPQLEYLDTASFQNRYRDLRIDIGAFEYKPNLSVQSQASHRLKCYPNPLTGSTLYSNILSPLPFEIYDLQARYIMGGIFYHGRVEISPLPAGTYVIVTAFGTMKLHKLVN